jgi:hypothetical protein
MQIHADRIARLVHGIRLSSENLWQVFRRKVLNVPPMRALFFVLCAVGYAVVVVLVTANVSGTMGLVLGIAPWIIGCIATIRQIKQDKRR